MGAIQFLSVNDCCCICVQGSTDVRGTGHMRVRRRLAAAGMGSGLPWGDGDERRLQAAVEAARNGVVCLYVKGGEVQSEGQNEIDEVPEVATADLTSCAPKEQAQVAAPNASLFVFHVPEAWEDEDLRRAFEPFAAPGRLLSASVSKDKATGGSKGFGFVYFDNGQSAAAAIAAMHGKHVQVCVCARVGSGVGGSVDLHAHKHQQRADTWQPCAGQTPAGGDQEDQGGLAMT